MLHDFFVVTVKIYKLPKFTINLIFDRKTGLHIFWYNKAHIYIATFLFVTSFIHFKHVFSVNRWLFTASLDVVICANTGVVGESAETTFILSNFNNSLLSTSRLVAKSNALAVENTLIDSQGYVFSFRSSNLSLTSILTVAIIIFRPSDSSLMSILKE